MNLRKEDDSIYIAYYRLPPHAWQRKITFYQEHMSDFSLIEKSERREVEIDYLIALFEVGKYRRFLDNVNPLIEAVIVENIFRHSGRDIYNDLLFRKAACHYNLSQFSEAINISKQLISIDEKEKTYRRLLKKAHFKLHRRWYDLISASAVLFLLLAVCTIIIEIFIIEPFYIMYLELTIMIKYFLLVLSAFLLLGNEIIHRTKIFDA